MIRFLAADKGNVQSSFESQKVSSQSLNPSYTIISLSVPSEAKDKRTQAKANISLHFQSKQCFAKFVFSERVPITWTKLRSEMTK